MNKFKKVLFLLLIIFLSKYSPSVAQNNTVTGYYNPIIPGFHPDPSICRVGDDYYLVTSSFEFFPGIPIYHSKDLINWKQIGHCLTRKSQLNLANTAIWSGIWAPTIRHNNRIFYMITTNVTNGGNFYVTATNPAGPWSEPIFVDRDMFDPSLLFDDDGKVYYTRRGKKGIVQSEINIRTGELKTPVKLIAEGFLSPDTEGPHLYKINGWYYLMTAEGGTRALHMINIGRSKSPWGPFEKCPNNPILAQHYDYHTIRSTGHGDLIQAKDGTWWMVFLGTRHYNYDAMSILGRETFLTPVKWENEWPTINQSVVNNLFVATPTLPLVPVLVDNIRDNFNEPELQPLWNFLRNPNPTDWSLSKPKGKLSLKGNKFNLSDVASPAFVGRRQQHINFEVETYLDFNATKPNEEAGLTTYMNFKQHYEFALTKRKNAFALIIRKTVGDITQQSVIIPINNSKVYLKIKGDKDLYTFSYSLDGKNFKVAGTGNPQFLGPELTSAFSGMYIAMYATGNGFNCINPALFNYFDYSFIKSDK